MNSSNIPRKKGTTSAAPATKIFKQKKNSANRLKIQQKNEADNLKNISTCNTQGKDKSNWFYD